MIYYVVIDTNVPVPAPLPSHGDAVTAQVVGKLFLGRVISLLDKEILREYAEVLRRKKFGLSKETVSPLTYVIKKYGEILAPTPIGEILPDMKDLPFYEVVLEKSEEETCLVTGNLKHFPIKPSIVTVRGLLNILNGGKQDTLNCQKRLFRAVSFFFVLKRGGRRLYRKADYWQLRRMDCFIKKPKNGYFEVALWLQLVC